MNGNCILSVARHLLEINGGYCGGNDRRELSIIMSCIDLQDHLNSNDMTTSLNFG